VTDCTPAGVQSAHDTMELILELEGNVYALHRLGCDN
jgi:hypothetical protein